AARLHRPGSRSCAREGAHRAQRRQVARPRARAARLRLGDRRGGMTTAASKHVLDEYAAIRASLPAGVVSPERRQEAVQALAACGLPSTRDENWRYTNLRPLERARFAPVAVSPGSATDGTAALATPARLDGFA